MRRPWFALVYAFHRLVVIVASLPLVHAAADGAAKSSENATASVAGQVEPMQLPSARQTSEVVTGLPSSHAPPRLRGIGAQLGVPSQTKPRQVVAAGQVTVVPPPHMPPAPHLSPVVQALPSSQLMPVHGMSVQLAVPLQTRFTQVVDVQVAVPVDVQTPAALQLSP